LYQADSRDIVLATGRPPAEDDQARTLATDALQAITVAKSTQRARMPQPVSAGSHGSNVKVTYTLMPLLVRRCGSV
jgi:hypothetical protein